MSRSFGRQRFEFEQAGSIHSRRRYLTAFDPEGGSGGRRSAPLAVFGPGGRGLGSSARSELA